MTPGELEDLEELERCRASRDRAIARAVAAEAWAGVLERYLMLAPGEAPARPVPADLDQLDALAAAATPGPWEWSKYGLRNAGGYFVRDNADGVFEGMVAQSGQVQAEADAAFIAAARTAVPALVQELRWHRCSLARLAADAADYLTCANNGHLDEGDINCGRCGESL